MDVARKPRTTPTVTHVKRPPRRLESLRDPCSRVLAYPDSRIAARVAPRLGLCMRQFGQVRLAAVRHHPNSQHTSSCLCKGLECHLMILLALENSRKGLHETFA